MMRQYAVFRVACLVLISGAILAGVSAQRGSSEPAKSEVTPAATELVPGLSQKEVLRLRGQPQHKARQILYRRYREQWVYDEPNAVRVEFDCVRGQEPRILTVQRLTSQRP
jgi:hypothetical protein